MKRFVVVFLAALVGCGPDLAGLSAIIWAMTSLPTVRSTAWPFNSTLALRTSTTSAR